MSAGIEVPERVRAGDLVCVMSVSGGKDSTACALALREAGVSFRMVFADTGWEAPETYSHLDHLREKLGPIDVVGVPGGMVTKIRHRAGFPSRLGRWCTQELKLEPLRAYHDKIEGGTVSAVGVRAAESEARAKLSAFDDDDAWGGWIWRPIIRWSVEDVLEIHHRHGVIVNPLYRRGHERVGCYPCIFSGKEEIRLIAEHSPERVSQIRALETECAELRDTRNAESPGRYSPGAATYFQPRDPSGKQLGIDEVVEWSKTGKGGRQLQLLAPVPEGGCFRWGLCEPPAERKE